MRTLTTASTILAAAVLAASLSSPAFAEPYLAVANGLKCVNCHTNPTGGGKRTAFGAAFARGQLASRLILQDDDIPPWDGELHERFAVGGDFRGGYESTDTPGVGDRSDTALTQGTLYAEMRVVPQLLSFYLDYEVAPDDTQRREAYALVTPADGRYTVKLGQFFRPFGLRLHDDSAFVRQASGVNYNTPDDGIELGLELPKWSAQVAVTDGTVGGPDLSGKRETILSAAYVEPMWRLGVSMSLNEDPFADRRMQGIFAGFRTGPIAWLAELDYITDELPTGDHNIYASLFEGNWQFRRGHNLKVSYEYFDPDRDLAEDERERYSVVWEHGPVQLLQVRAGMRFYNGVPNRPSTNRDEAFVELHLYF